MMDTMPAPRHHPESGGPVYPLAAAPPSRLGDAACHRRGEPTADAGPGPNRWRHPARSGR